MVLGGLAAAAVGIHLHSPFSVKLAMFVDRLAGRRRSGWPAPGALRAYRGVNETISIAAAQLHRHRAPQPHRRGAAARSRRASTSRRRCRSATTTCSATCRASTCTGASASRIIACLIAWFLMKRTTFGFAARMVGGNVRAALLNGLPVRRLIVVATFLGGLGAGLAGAVEVAAIHGNANASLVTGYGYTGVLVAFIARANPFGVIPVALLLGGIGASGGLLQRVFELPGRDRQRAAGDDLHRDPVLGFALRPALGSRQARRRRWRRERGRWRRAGNGRRRDPHQHAVPVRQPGRVPDREERPREPRPRRDAGHGRDGRLRRLLPDGFALARRAGGRAAAASCWGRCTPGSAPGRASTTSPSGSRSCSSASGWRSSSASR